ncbi:hypothetical protein Q2K19_03295 [Micromonospora soli]|uniref:hypothetical protein n=1 Tax=Micromonospora sp. NBRC 110009 TaxID=3061627 RepID=UPI00267256A2|nr:hypothetical protein [Micromonospora sp. NBRC 110009]WKT99544.1 hypothetical protein Q2K19_03295 [Micromonospora sp. NBRC 110009]
MTDHGSTPESPRHPDPRTATADGLGTVPDWLRQPQVDAEPSGADRWRIWLNQHSVKLLGGAAALLLLAFFGLVGTAGYRAVQRWGEPSAAYPTISQPPGEQAVTSASPPPAAGPFDGTPAAAFPEAPTGIVLPTAKRTGPFTEKQVAAGLAKVRTALLMGRLDRRFMTAETPDRFLRLFAPDARANMRDDFASGAAVSYATRLAPGARITDHQPRVKGRVSYRSTRDRDGIRVIEVTTNFVWVYAFRSPTPDPSDGVVLVHDTVVWHVPHPADVRTSSNGLWIDTADSYGSNIECATFDKGLVDIAAPQYGGPLATEDPDAMFDPERSLDIAESC